MLKYSNQTRLLVSVDCIVIGFDGQEYKLLLVQKGSIAEKEKWSVMGGFLQPSETLEQAASRVVLELTGIKDVYLEQLCGFSDPNRDPIERILGMAHVALVDIKKYEDQLSDEYLAKWFPMNNLPSLVLDHREMVNMALNKLRYNAALHPILFELLPEKFTLPQLQILYEGLYDIVIDKRNFSRKVLSTGIIKRLSEKDKSSSKKGAYYYRLMKRNYKEKFNKVLNFIPKNEIPKNIPSVIG
ncbi:NUDIX hydrolase [Pleomorphovibrio marinus]|uniref:NUDIX hydrolase n=1 Tax=Pleomorphovibrio marinus TaxID=2164132 RepID=UPI000E0C02AE|nr:NUDIX domain-containing protein [Pleomorphovibrio marinus]